MESAVSVPLGCFSRVLLLGLLFWGLSHFFGWGFSNSATWPAQIAASPSAVTRWGSHLYGVLLYYAVQFTIIYLVFYALTSLIPGEVGTTLQKLLSDFAKQFLKLIFRLFNLVFNGIFRVLYRLVEGGLNRH